MDDLFSWYDGTNMADAAASSTAVAGAAIPTGTSVGTGAVTSGTAGTNWLSAALGALQTGSSIAGNIIGQQNAASAQKNSQATQVATAQITAASSNFKLIALVVGGIVTLGLIFFFVRRRK